LPDALHDEIHIHHAPQGARALPHGAAGHGDEAEGQTYTIVIRRDGSQPPLTRREVSKVLRQHFSDRDGPGGWRTSFMHIDEGGEPPCIRVRQRLAPPEGLDWRNDADLAGRLKRYFARYDEVAASVTRMLTVTWDWIVAELVKLGHGDIPARVVAAAAQPASAQAGLADNELYKRLVDIISTQAAESGGRERFNISTLAEKLGTSRRTLERDIAEISDATPAGIVREIRLAMACDLLAECHNVKQVAGRVGFSASHFAELFHKRYGEYPSDRLERLQRVEQDNG
jgi:AraC-like DNA-binding protein